MISSLFILIIEISALSAAVFVVPQCKTTDDAVTSLIASERSCVLSHLESLEMLYPCLLFVAAFV